MAQPVPPPRISFRDYVAGERVSETKHEFLEGHVWAMAGGTPEHAQLAANVIAELRNQLGAGPCKVFTSDLRIAVLETGLTTYPDVTVVCGPFERHPEDDSTVTNPAVIVEVLSDSTEAYDRGKKFAHYRRIASLRAYVLVSQHEPRIEIYRPNADGTWMLAEVGPGASARVADLASLSVDGIYAGVALPVA